MFPSIRTELYMHEYTDKYTQTYVFSPVRKTRFSYDATHHHIFICFRFYEQSEKEIIWIAIQIYKIIIDKLKKNSTFL
jgi:hypothetical protein